MRNLKGAWSIHWRKKVEHVTVTAADLKRGELTLPEISAPVVAIPAVGDVPVLTFEHDDGSPGTLEEFHGQYVIVHFWASWCGPCKQQLPALHKLHDELGSTRKVAIVSLSLDDDAVVVARRADGKQNALAPRPIHDRRQRGTVERASLLVARSDWKDFEQEQ